jgi:protocatechuate 3,4-dioxygenase beta subunit
VAEGRASLRLDGVKAQPLDSVTEIVVRMQERVTISGVIRDANGAAMPYAIVEGAAVDADGRDDGFGAVALSDAHGRFRWPVMYEGKYALRTPGHYSSDESAAVRLIEAKSRRDNVIELVAQE